MRYRPDEIKRYGLEPYAVYGGYVYSFTCPAATGDRIYDADLLDGIFEKAQKQALDIIATRRTQTQK
jgi:hypothetical protein